MSAFLVGMAGGFSLVTLFRSFVAPLPVWQWRIGAGLAVVAAIASEVAR